MPIVLLVVVVLLLPLMRNAYGVLTVLVLGAALVAATTLEPLPVAYVLTWFLLLGAVRAVGEGARLSDADAMARATHVPGVVWRALFWLVALGAAGLGGWWMWSVLSRSL